MTARVFCDTSVLIRYFAEDDVPRAAAAAALVESDRTLVISTTVLIELTHTLRTGFAMANPLIARLVIAFLSRPNVELADADKDAAIAGLFWSEQTSARRIPDALLSAAATRAGAEFIATFDEQFISPGVPVRLL